MSYPTQLNGERYQVDSILHIFDLHACDLPQYYVEQINCIPSTWHLIDENHKPHVQIAGQFTNWVPKDIDDIIDPDLYCRYQRYFGTDENLWPSHRYEIVLPPGKYQYKWIVNGEWKCAKSAPLIYDSDGNLNNFLDTSNCTYELDCIEQDRQYNEYSLVREYASTYL